MDNTLPKMYDNLVSSAVRSLKHGYSSKSGFTKIDEQASELTNEQRYEFFKRIRDSLILSLTEHSKICKDPTHCAESLGSEQAINSMNKRMSELEPLVNAQQFKSALDEAVQHPTDHTTARQVLAMKFLLEYAKINVGNDRAGQRFMHFFTGKSQDNLYKLWRNPYNKDLFTAEVEDLRFIRNLFEDLGATEIVKAINNQIDKP